MSERVEEVAEAILNGASVDWASEVSSADLAGRLLLEQLRLVAAVADVHRRVPSASRSTQIDPARTAPPPPGQWGHLRVLEPVGRGAFGEVYRAWDTRLDREVALKLLPAEGATRDPRVTTIIDEGRLLARVRHPNVVTIYGAERIEHHVGLWMELVHGQTLQQMLAAGRSFTPADVVRIGIELCGAVEAVHASGLVHRDIKPHNVMLEASGRLVLMDFGSGRELADPSAAALAGTPLYLAPELLAGNEPSPQSDIYSLGVLLYHLLTLTYPVRAANLHALRAAHEHGQRTDLRSTRKDVPRRVVRIIDRALSPRPEMRYRRAADLSKELVRYRDWTRIRPVTYGVAAAAVLLLAWVGLVPLWSSDRDRRSATESTVLSSASRRAIAVLPFKPLVDNERDERLQLGMTDALIAQLGRIRTLRVEPLARVRSYVAAGTTPLEAGRVLGAEAVAQGYVHKTPAGVAVRLQVLRTADGASLTASGSDHTFANVLDAQHHIVELLSNALELTPTERASIRRQDTTSPEAFQHYSFGLYHLEVFTHERMQQAEREFREAIRLDPRYARPHAALALTMLNMVWLGGKRGIDVREPARASALAAIELDDSVALAYTVLGHIYQYFDYAPFEAQRAHLRAMELDDQDVSVLRAYSYFLLHHDAFDEALDVHRRTLELYPASPLSNRISADMHFVARRYDECVAECRKARALEPNDANLNVSTWLGRCLEQQGKHRDAIDAFERNLVASGDAALARRARRAFERGGWTEYWRVRLPPLIATGPSLGAAAVHLRLGNLEAAMTILEQLEQTRSLGGFSNYPDYDALRSEPRFHALRARVGMSDEINAQLAAARRAGQQGRPAR